ncbi:phosphatidylinositol-glycan biosynthesis class W protein [Chiloscyllium plagiosum]|uniref:phosphatidylinositol-glycan biosynthesis class W protein n=1 Tax=Chiloscyllium plagiosum TaxID=36176 RepID=UPI001CB8579C|nr:phosphatidylinositol-glycan biosynthesis class W protein [Chiloscyllium plagiosum]
MAEKELKVEFISNLSGTTLAENLLGLILSALCITYRGLILMYFVGESVTSSWKRLLLIDFFVLVAFLILSCTVLANVLHWLVLVLAAVLALFVFKIYSQRKQHSHQQLKEVIKSFLETNLDVNYIPFVTLFRVFINIKTGISILAVDFPIFPRRYAKAETYGTGIMDFGVAAFVFANAVVSPEARQKNKTISYSKFSFVIKQIIAVWPLVFLGLARLISVKTVDYHEHVTEYGLHWNFFFTLAIVRVLSSFLLILCPVRSSWILSASIAICYQLLLETTNLKQFILHGSDGKGTRFGFINANREGLFSLFGYIAIYMAGVQVGVYIMKTRTSVKDWIKVQGFLLMSFLILWLLLHVSEALTDPVSRRMANLSFVLWTVGQSLFFLMIYLLADLVLVFVKVISGMVNVPSSWNILPDSSEKTKDRKLFKSHSFGKLDKTTVHFCLIEAVSRNQLLFFLQSNILTGLVNLTIDTIHSSTFISLFVLLVYMFCNCIIVYILHINDITLKFW